MRNSLKTVVFSALSVMFSVGLRAETHRYGKMDAANDASTQQIIKGTGVAEDVGLSSEKVTISHKAIPAVGWPATTMRSTSMNTDDNITAPKAGTHVDFTFVQQGNTSLLKSINDTQS